MLVGAGSPVDAAVVTGTGAFALGAFLERLAFNANVDIFNAIAEELGATFGEDGSYEELNAAWDYYLTDLQVDQDARFALTAVADHFFA